MELEDSIIFRLQKGERIKCEKCNKGYYFLPENFSECKSFHCDTCDNFCELVPECTVE